ncbi:MAG: hypothetical protein AUJ72_02360 [Candidatus Omnitrophica bacterium CG1_02_46_14]|nr:MAG: hypothetical protein AUJ72_02360 [Candidatus Omnitrophica bacterium CG1_02_46_14]
MWKFVIFNSVWFLFLFNAHALDRWIGKKKTVLLILVSALVMVFPIGVDPLAWAYYLAFSLVVYSGGLRFKQWVFARGTVLDEAIEQASNKLHSEKEAFAKQTGATELVNQQSNEIYYLYDKIKEMSQCLDQFEALVVFGEALFGQFHFETLTLVLFNEAEHICKTPQEILRLKRSDFEGLFDKNQILKNKARYEIDKDPSLEAIIDHAFLSGKPVHETSLVPTAAYPIPINKNISGILIVAGEGCMQNTTLPVFASRFISEIERIKLYEKVETLAVTDGLTGVAVRRHLMERFEGELNRSKKFDFNLSVLMIDVDYFKGFNDRYGHLVGDVVLKQTAETIKKNIRELDLVGRYGGEEFLVLLVETDLSGALYVAERIRAAIAGRIFKAYDENLKSTVSIGCSGLSKDRPDAGSILESADQALYQAKHQGRNRVCLGSRQDSDDLE